MDEPRNEEPTDPVDDAPSGPPRAPLGTYDAQAPRHASQFEIEGNVSRIAIQIAQGRRATYD